jgi:branched-chain amino acid transport system permease protein
LPNASDTRTITAAPVRRRFTVTRSRLVTLALLVALVVLALNAPAMMPNAYILSIAIVILNYAALATSWNFMGGFTGYISLGHAAYFGLGAYGTALLITKASVPSFVALVLAALVVAVLAVPIGIAALRVRGASFVIVSIALVLILLLVFQSWASFTGGSSGLTVPRPFPELLRAEHHLRFYFLYLALLAVALACWWAIDRSRFGMGLKAIREDEDKAQSLGVPTFAYKLIAFVVSATFTAATGGLYALWFGDLDPVFQFSILIGAYMVLMSLLGGVRSLFGPALGALIVGFALEYFKVSFGDSEFHLAATGILLAVVVLFMPEGIIPASRALYDRVFGGGETSIREMTAEDLLARDRRQTADPAETADPAITPPTSDRAEVPR